MGKRMGRMKVPEGLRYPSEHAVLHIASIGGRLEYLGADVSHVWLCGGRGPGRPGASSLGLRAQAIARSS